MIFLVCVATVVFVGRVLSSYYLQLQKSLFSISVFKIICSMVLFLVYLYLRALSWQYVVKGFNTPISASRGFFVWFASESTRFIPGSVWSYASRAYLSKLPKNVNLLMVPLEIILVATSTAILSIYSVVQNISVIPLRIIFLIIVILLSSSVLGLFFTYKKIRILIIKLLVLDVSLSDFIKAFGLQFVSWFLYGFATVLLVQNLSFAKLLLLLSAVILSWLVGYISIIPMGLGVREGVFIFLTGGLIGIPQATLVAVFSRVLLILVEIVNLLFWLIVRKRFSRHSQ